MGDVRRKKKRVREDKLGRVEEVSAEIEEKVAKGGKDG